LTRAVLPMPVFRGHSANKAEFVSIGGQPAVHTSTNVEIKSDTVLVVAVTRSSGQVAVVALLSLVAVPEVLLFLHGTESAVDLNVQTSATSSVGHSQECTSSTLFNTFALKLNDFDGTNVLTVAISSVTSGSTQVAAASTATTGWGRRRSSTSAEQTTPSVSADNTISIQTTRSLEVLDSAVSSSSELTVDGNSSTKLGTKEILHGTNCISSGSATENGTESSNGVGTYDTISSKTSATLESDNSVVSAGTELTIRSDIVTVMTQQILNADYICASRSLANVLGQSGANKGEEDDCLVHDSRSVR
jgi:hypothetical protein